MIVQVKNTARPNYNIIRSTTSSLMRDVKNQGWNIKDCQVTELSDELVNANYRGVDGKTGNKYKK